MHASPTVLTLDAGGTNFVFSAMRDNEPITAPLTLPAHADDLDKCLATLLAGFETIAQQANSEIDAISFAFPGPADYQNGIIGNLPNFKAFNGDVPLGPVLTRHFNVPVFINNDGNLFAAGMVQGGFLAQLNARLLQAGSKKKFDNLIGITLGTGFGCGIVLNGHTLVGDNSCAAEIHNTLNPFYKTWNAEESVSTRAIQRVYAEVANVPVNRNVMPKDIYDIAYSRMPGDVNAAQISFQRYGQALGASIANVLTLIDGIVVIGGGLSASWDLFAPHMFAEINKAFETVDRTSCDRLSFKVFDLENPSAYDAFLKGEIRTVAIPGSDEVIHYDALPRTGIARSVTDGSLATSRGAYAFAVQHLSRLHHEQKSYPVF